MGSGGGGGGENGQDGVGTMDVMQSLIKNFGPMIAKNMMNP